MLPIILSGGTGTRLWPVSREAHPKPFMRLADGQSLLEKTYRRAAQLPGCLRANGIAQVMTVTNQNYYFLTRDEEVKAGVQSHYLLEPFARNTAPAIAMAAYQALARYGEDVTLLVLPADHLIAHDILFNEAVTKAQALAADNLLVTFGVLAKTPETGFGYIEFGEPLRSGFKVQRFVEKPSLEKAKAFIAAGNYGWNAGIFCFKAKTFLDQLAVWAPKLATQAQACWEQMHGESFESSTLEIPANCFETMANISIDYALLERSDKVAVVSGDFGWNDIGSWSAVRDLATADANGNRLLGDGVFVDSTNTFIQTENRLVAAVGLNNVMIIDTPDALLVAHESRSQDVKTVVEHLKIKDHEVVRLHQTVSRPWGTYTVLEEGTNFKIKRIEVKPQARLSLQMHHHRSEHWIVVNGSAKVVNGDQVLHLNANESTYIPAGHKHRLENVGSDTLVLIEVQSGTYTGEDDIVRFADEYGRT